MDHKFTDKFPHKHKESLPENTTKSAQEQTAPDNSSDTPDANNELHSLRKELSDLQDLNNRLKLTLAESENEKKRTIRHSEERIRHSLSEFALGLSEVVELFFLAVSSIDQETLAINEKFKSFFAGVEMTKERLLKILAEHGIERVYPLDQLFNPSLHEAVSQIESDKPAGTVVEVSKSGYTMHNKLLVAAMVVVSKGPPANS